ncbi:hypothetical protein DPEC_G00321890 [Dallia pectoralis]|uniref:Uncharacterized protein n=1 Tax=Dallia pectoralis TaxID=75939 RepID=A0ACC2FAK3_DALPE|nr:hypothetical protein DPEC_G00321890 [Dallia pectoralis]
MTSLSMTPVMMICYSGLGAGEEENSQPRALWRLEGREKCLSPPVGDNSPVILCTIGDFWETTIVIDRDLLEHTCNGRRSQIDNLESKGCLSGSD